MAANLQSLSEQQRALLMPKVKQQYRVLRIVSFLLMAIAMAVVIFGVFGGVFLMFTPSFTYDFASNTVVRGDPLVGQGAGFAFMALISGLILFAFAQLIQIQISREENARLTNALLFELFRRRRS